MVRRAAPVLAAGWLAAAWLWWGALAGLLPAASDRVELAVAALISMPLAAGCGIAWAAAAEPRPLRRLIMPAAVVVAAAVVAALLGGWAPLEALAKIAVAVSVGVAAARVFDAPWQVALVAVAIVPVDIWSVVAGPTGELVHHHPSLLGRLAVPIVSLGGRAALLGMTDFLFLGLFTAAVIRWDLRPRVTLPLLALSFVATLVAAYALDRALAALPLLSLALLLPNLGRLRRR